MLNNAVIQDLKDFIEATVSGQLASQLAAFEDKLDEKLERKFTEKLAPIEAKIDQLSSDVAAALTVSNKSLDSRLIDHEKRITRLELKAA